MWEWRNRDLDDLHAALVDNNVTLSLLSSDPELDITDPSTHDEFVEAVEASAQAAKRLGCANIVVTAGETLTDVDHETQTGSVVAALRRAAPVVERHGVTLLLENLNSVGEDEGNFLDTASAALEIIDAVASGRVRLLYDLYHSVMMGEDPSEVLAGAMDRVAYVQIADVPGNHEPGSGDIDWHRELRWLFEAGYDGPLGLEYSPTGSSETSFVYLRSVLKDILP
jgi:hydroxypyruvate isomerase